MKCPKWADNLRTEVTILVKEIGETRGELRGIKWVLAGGFLTFILTAAMKYLGGE